MLTGGYVRNGPFLHVTPQMFEGVRTVCTKYVQSAGKKSREIFVYLHSMKKIILTIAALMAALVARADEGMWLLPLLKSLNADVMAAEGCRLSPEQIYSVNQSSLKDAVVIFGQGCTGEIISDEGLLVTNHHCGYSSIQALSTPEHNYLMDGWWAKNRAEELKVPGLDVTFLISMEDVTDRANAAREKDGQEGIEKFFEELENSAEATNPGCEATVESFYSRNVYYLIVYKKYDDVRFVGAPPSAVGKFGGDTDNWVWPRHTGDFSMFRVYDKDGKPLKPRKSLEISLKGVKENDFTMILGYPGSTQRYQTAAELEMMLASQEVSIACRTLRQDVLKKWMAADPVIRLKYADKYADSSNGWKKWQGEKLSFKRLGLLDKKRQDEAAFQRWVDADTLRQRKYGKALAEISDMASQMTAPLCAAMLLFEGPFSVELPQFAMQYIQEQMKDGDVSKVLDAYKDYDAAVDKEVARVMLEYYRKHAPESMALDSLGAGYEIFSEIDIDKYVDYLFAESVFTSRGKLEQAAADTTFAVQAMEDPAALLASALMGNIYAVYPALITYQYGSPSSRAYTAGLMEYYGDKPLYPDANFTMRLTYGKVLPYEPKDGLKYQYYTTLEGVMEKEIPGDMEFDVPAKLKQLHQARDYGRYADKKDGKLHLCFITDNDITGGNSGSPVLDADGRLVGLAFDGDWESMSSDVLFEPELTRCICVDIRYVLFCMDKLGGAGYLLKEMKIKK